MCIYALIYSTYICYGFVISPLFGSIGYEPTDSAISVMICVLVGAISAMTTGKILDKTSKYLLTLRVICFGGSVVVLTGIYTICGGSTWGMVLYSIGAGMFFTPSIPACFAFATEVTYPLQPALVTGMLMTAAMELAFVLDMLYISIMKPPAGETFGDLKQAKTTILVMAVNPVLAFILSLFVKEDLRRLNSVSDVSMQSNSLVGEPKSPKYEYK